MNVPIVMMEKLKRYDAGRGSVYGAETGIDHNTDV